MTGNNGKMHISKTYKSHKIHGTGIFKTYSAKGLWNASLNFIFPTKYVFPKSLKVGHWLSEFTD